MSLQTDINKIKAFFTPAESNEAKALAYVDNPDSVFDNLARYVRFAIWLLLIPSAYIGINYHIKLFQKNGMGEMGANVGSFIFFIAIEIFCCFYATDIFRAIYNGSAFKGLKQLFGIVLSLCLIAYCYYFKYNISASAFSEQNAISKKTELSEKYVSSSPKGSTYDAQIKDAQKTIDRAKKQTWGGKLTPKGEYLLGEGNKTMQRLLDLKNKELTEVNKRDSLYNSDGRAGIETAQKSANNYGGIIELALLACTLLLPLFEMAAYDAYKERTGASNDVIAEGQGLTDFNTIQAPAKPYVGFSTNKNISNIENRTTIGFKYGTQKDIPPIEKKNNDLSDKTGYYEKIINSHQILSNLESDKEKKKYYEKIIKSHQIILNLL